MVRKIHASKKGRPVNGILILDKPIGISSNSALQQVKRLFEAQKAGHTGSLDPLATGVLPICLGEATKISHYLLDADKRYRAKCVLGSVTTTGDSEGEIIAVSPVPDLKKEQLVQLLQSFLGTQEQTPPMYSALKHNGRPLYEYARQGINIERKSRQITIKELQLLDFQIHSEATELASFFEVEVLCSKGTYIRSLCEDIGQAIGCGGYISELRRLESGPFLLSDAVTLSFLQAQISHEGELSDAEQIDLDKLLKPTDLAIKEFPVVQLSEPQFQDIQHGKAIEVDIETETKSNFVNFRLYFNNTLIALAILDNDGKLKPKRLLFL